MTVFNVAGYLWRRWKAQMAGNLLLPHDANIPNKFRILKEMYIQKNIAWWEVEFADCVHNWCLRIVFAIASEKRFVCMSESSQDTTNILVNHMPNEVIGVDAFV